MMPDAFPIFFRGRQPYEGQSRAMAEIVRGTGLLFGAPTASGKTEAAVTPLFQRHLSFRRQSLSTIYVAPTKALVNDLYERLVTYLGTRFPSAVARYTGDRHEFRADTGSFCLLATPEALDSLHLRRPKALADVRAVIVDEIHLLHGQPRGQQLRHVIDRIRGGGALPKSSQDHFQVVGMTATLDDIETVGKIWLGEGAKVIVHGSPREIACELIATPNNPGDDPQLIRAKCFAQWLRQANLDKILVFTNSRNAAHEFAAHLHHELRNDRWPVHLHFGPLSASHREQVEEDMRRKRFGLCVATSTLEIGIDIGDIDAIVLAEIPSTVGSFLQRIGRGNRRSGTCRVVAFRASDDDERIVRALVDCGRRGELDDAFEYDRPSVRFQQILSLCWRATRQDRALSPTKLAKEANTDCHAAVINDMVETGCLKQIRTALVPSDRLMEEGDAGRIHTVIIGRQSSAILDLRTGESVIRDADTAHVGSRVFVGGSMRRLLIGPSGDALLGDGATRLDPLARIKATSGRAALGRAVVWGLARQLGQDPTRWQFDGAELITWGGETLNILLAALFARESPGKSFKPSMTSITGELGAHEISIAAVRDFALQAERTNDLPLHIARKFMNSSRYLSKLSHHLAAEEMRRSIPWNSLNRWLDRVSDVVEV